MINKNIIEYEPFEIDEHNSDPLEYYEIKEGDKNEKHRKKDKKRNKKD